MADSTDDETLRRIWRETRVIAVFGMTDDPAKPSHYVPKFLQEQGYRIVPVNPVLAGQNVLGETVYGSFADVPAELAVDMVDVFRRSERVPPVVSEALADLPALRTIWMQMGISNQEAAAAAIAHGKTVVQDRCPRVEIPRLFGARSPLL